MYGTGFRGRLHDSVRPCDICSHHISYWAEGQIEQGSHFGFFVILIWLMATLNRVLILGFCCFNLADGHIEQGSHSVFLSFEFG